MTRGGRGWLALALAAGTVIGTSAAARIGPAAPEPGTVGTAVSSTWLCPHGGGPGWGASIQIANPGDAPISARLISYGHGQPKTIADTDVPAHGEILREVPASVRASATRVDLFGGWGAVGWVVQASGKESGLGAEPCTSAPGSSWYVVDGATPQRTHSFLIVTDPFTADAVINVTLFLPDAPPVRSAAWTDLPVDAGTSVALDLGAKSSGALGQPIVGAEVIATRGRIAVSSLAVRDGGGVRSVLAAPAPAPRWILPIAAGSGGGTASLVVPSDTPIRYIGTQVSSDTRPQTAGTLADARQGGASTVSAPVRTSGATAVILGVTQGGPIGAGLREAGPGRDEGATGGTPTASADWVVLPTAFGLDPRPSMVLVNDGDQPVAATLTLLHEGGGSVGDTTSVTVGAQRTLAVPGSFLRSDHTAAVLVNADGPVVALGAGLAGAGDSSRFAMALGVPIPQGASLAAP
jgi:hypothetical protein